MTAHAIDVLQRLLRKARRSFASLRGYGGKSHRQTADLLGHEDVRFTLNVYAQSGLDPNEMLPPVCKAFDGLEFTRSVDGRRPARP